MGLIFQHFSSETVKVKIWNSLLAAFRKIAKSDN